MAKFCTLCGLTSSVKSQHVNKAPIGTFIDTGSTLLQAN